MTFQFQSLDFRIFIQIVRETGPTADPHIARAREAQATQVRCVREELQPVL